MSRIASQSLSRYHYKWRSISGRSNQASQLGFRGHVGFKTNEKFQHYVWIAGDNEQGLGVREMSCRGGSKNFYSERGAMSLCGC